MATPQPKQFKAAVNFSYLGRSYRRGDPVTDPRSLDRLTRYGTRFLTTVKPAKADTPESPKED